MGYTSDWTIIVDPIDFREDFLEELEEASGYGWDDNRLYDSKWYDADKDLEKVSKSFEYAFITCEQVGEDGDRSMRYVHNGFVADVSARITYPAPDWWEEEKKRAATKREFDEIAKRDADRLIQEASDKKQLLTLLTKYGIPDGYIYERTEPSEDHSERAED